MRNKKPIIGITCEVDKLKPFYSEFYLCCDFRYVRAVLRAGGVPLLIPIIFYKKRALYILKRINGLIIVGGADIPPRFYGENKSKEVQSTYGGRIHFETYLYKKARMLGIPILGICYGMQLINIIQGGTLYKDIKTDLKKVRLHDSEKYPFHPVEVQQGSLCFNIFQKKAFMVHSDHHQAVKKLGRSLSISAVSDDGIPEAVEKPPNIIAVQWHPERQPKDIIQKRLFKYFIGLSAKTIIK